MFKFKVCKVRKNEFVMVNVHFEERHNAELDFFCRYRISSCGFQQSDKKEYIYTIC
jgi:hypothetical protein